MRSCTKDQVSTAWVQSVVRTSIESQGIAVVLACLRSEIEARRASTESLRRYKVLEEAERIVAQAFREYVSIKA